MIHYVYHKMYILILEIVINIVHQMVYTVQEDKITPKQIFVN